MSASRDASTTTGEEVGGVIQAPPAPSGPSAWWRRIVDIAGNVPGRLAVVGGFALMVIVFAILSPDVFLEPSTIRNILDQAVVPAVLACGLTFVLVTGEFDLSFTATLGVGAGIAIVLMTMGWPVLPAILVALAVGLVVGLAVGALVTMGRASSFIVTLAIGSVVIGIEQAITGNKSIYEGISSAYPRLALEEFAGLRAPVWFALGVVVLSTVVLHATRFGRQARALGANLTAAYLAGVKVRKIKIAVFAILAVLAVCAGLILTARSSSYYANASAGLLLNTYAAVFLGAAAAARSQFTILGSAFGVLWITTLQAGLTITNQPAWASNIIQGLVLAAAVLIAAGGRQGAR